MVSVRAYILASVVVMAGIAVGTGLAQPIEQTSTQYFQTYAVPSDGTGVLPPDQNVQMNIRAMAWDPLSIITHKVNVLLTAVEVNNNEVAWQVAELVIRQLSEFGEIEGIWSANKPSIETPDGLWRVVHDDPTAPRQDEFSVLPWMVGIAQSSDLALDDLLYDLHGSVYVSPPEGAPYAITGSLSYVLATETTPSDPVAEGDDEPIEIPDTGDEDVYPV